MLITVFTLYLWHYTAHNANRVLRIYLQIHPFIYSLSQPKILTGIYVWQFCFGTPALYTHSNLWWCMPAIKADAVILLEQRGTEMQWNKVAWETTAYKPRAALWTAVLKNNDLTNLHLNWQILVLAGKFLSRLLCYRCIYSLGTDLSSALLLCRMFVSIKNKSIVTHTAVCDLLTEGKQVKFQVWAE